MTRSLGFALLVGVAIVAVAGIAVRFTNLGASGFWYDELIVRDVARQPAPIFWEYVRYENHPPLYFLLVRQLVRAGFDSAAALRFASAAAGAAAVVILSLAVRSMVGRSAGLAALFLAATSSALTFYSREARMYPLVMLFSAISLWTFWRWLERPRIGRTVAFVAATALLLWTHYTGLALVVAQALFFLLDRRHHRVSLRRGVAVATTIAALFAPWVAFSVLARLVSPIGLPTWYQHANPDPWAGLATIRHALMFDSFPIPALQPWEPLMVNVLRPIASLITGLLAVVGFWTARAWFRRGGDGPATRATAYLAVVAAAPLLAGLVIRYDQVKFFLPSVLSVIGLAAVGAAWLWKKFPVAAAVGFALLSLFALVYLPVLARVTYPWQPAAAYLEAEARPEDVILVHQWFNVRSLNEYYRGATPVVGVLPRELPARNEWVREVRYNAVPVITPDALSWIAEVTSGTDRVWFINNHNAPFFRSGLVRAWFLDHGWAITDEPAPTGVPGGWLTVFERHPS